MTDDGRATVQLVYKEVNALRAEMLERLGDLDAKLESRFDTLLSAIEALRGSVVVENACRRNHEMVEQRIAAAIAESCADRERLWRAVRERSEDTTDVRKALDDTRAQVWKLVGSVGVLSSLLSALVSRFLR